MERPCYSTAGLRLSDGKGGYIIKGDTVLRPDVHGWRFKVTGDGKRFDLKIGVTMDRRTKVIRQKLW